MYKEHVVINIFFIWMILIYLVFVFIWGHSASIISLPIIFIPSFRVILIWILHISLACFWTLCKCKPNIYTNLYLTPPPNIVCKEILYIWGFSCSLFALIAVYNVIVWRIYHNVFIHSTIDRHLYCFHLSPLWTVILLILF